MPAPSNLVRIAITKRPVGSIIDSPMKNQNDPISVCFLGLLSLLSILVGNSGVGQKIQLGLFTNIVNDSWVKQKIASVKLKSK